VKTQELLDEVKSLQKSIEQKDKGSAIEHAIKARELLKRIHLEIIVTMEER